MARQVTSAADYSAVISGTRSLVCVYWWADFHPACVAGGQMDSVVTALASKHGNVTFVKAQPDDLPSVASLLGVNVVPTFTFLHGGKKIDAVEGANPPELLARVQKNAGRVVVETPSPAAAAGADDARLRGLVRSAPVMLFMKGSPAEPRCKFSRETVGILNEADVTFGSFDILSDPAVRAGLKVFANFPTFPMLFVHGKLVGGLDVIKSLHSGEKLRDIGAAPPPAPGAGGAGVGVVLDDALRARLDTMVKSSKCMLFMKGSPDEPKCGFSATIVELVRSAGVVFHHFDILKDNDVRQGLKKYAEWPTFPMLYVDAELVGGLDIVKEMAAEGDLATELGVQRDWVKHLVSSDRVFLFMKGSPEEPRCGFSKSIVALLQKHAVAFSHFDVLSDQGVRQGVKKFGDFPTFPQLYLKGELVGGLDIVRELDEEDELVDLLSAA